MAELKKGFRTPAEVTSYFDGKSLKPAFSWLDVSVEEHAYSFTVAKAVELELLSTFRSSISNAIASGQTFDNWRNDVGKELTRLGWWGPRMVRDQTGNDPDRMVDFSSPRRLKTIFWSNMNSARSAGQWERAQRTKKALPYILYVRTTSGDPRPEHLAWVGIILPIDHPFWKTHWPPNGWLCKCQVRQITAREAESLLGRDPAAGGVIYRSEVPDLGPDQLHRNRRTGEITAVPQGIDPGWQTNPGLTRATTLIQNLEVKLAEADPGDATRVVEALWNDPYARLAPRLADKTWLPAGVSQRVADELDAPSPVVSVTGDTISERLDKHGMTVDDFALLPKILAEGAVLPDPRGKKNVRAVVLPIGKTWWRAFVTRWENGYLRVTSLHQRFAKEIRTAFERAGVAWPFED